MIKLSHSAATRYQTCGMSYKLHYQDKLRPKTQSSALLFGSALDKAWEAMLSGLDGGEAFIKTWTFQAINKTETFLPESELLRYYDSDFDADLISLEDREKLTKYCEGLAEENLSWEDVFDHLLKTKKEKGYKAFSEKQVKAYNYIFWHSLKSKGLLMVQALKDKILPNITKVLSVQEKISLKNEEGDEIVGFVDFVARWKPHEDDVIVFDLKTASKIYESDAVVKSQQLALYSQALMEKYETKKCGFVVLCKQIKKNKTKICSVCNFEGTGNRAQTCNNEIEKKRCNGAWIETISPEVFIQVLIDNIPDRLQSMVVENFDTINQAVKAGVFVRNFSSCVMPYGVCSFYNLCHNGDSSDLVEVLE